MTTIHSVKQKDQKRDEDYEKQRQANAERAKAIRKEIDLVALAGRHTILKHNSARDQHGPCPRCGNGTGHSFHITTDNLFCCYSCHPAWGDVIEFTMWLHGIEFLEALSQLDGEVKALPVRKVQRQERQPTPEDRQIADQWLEKAAQQAELAHKRLMDENDQAAQAGRDYLLSRGLESATWEAFQLGFTEAYLPGTWNKKTQSRSFPAQSAITIPWFVAGKVAAIRYRFIVGKIEYTDADGNQRTGDKISSMTKPYNHGEPVADHRIGFINHVFGGHVLDRCANALRTLVIVEGELNCCSIWQVARETRLDVLSLGSESAGAIPALAKYAEEYGSVILWLDKADLVEKVQESLPFAYAVFSPDGRDANDLLKAGLLGGYLSVWRFHLAQNDPEKQARLLWDLYDAALLPAGIDQGTAQVAQALAKQLCKPINLHEAEPDRWIAGQM